MFKRSQLIIQQFKYLKPLNTRSCSGKKDNGSADPPSADPPSKEDPQSSKVSKSKSQSKDEKRKLIHMIFPKKKKVEKFDNEEFEKPRTSLQSKKKAHKEVKLVPDKKKEDYLESPKIRKKRLHVDTLGILGVPFGLGQSKFGVELAPNYLRKHNLMNILRNATDGEFIMLFKLKLNVFFIHTQKTFKNHFLTFKI